MDLVGRFSSSFKVPKWVERHIDRAEATGRDWSSYRMFGRHVQEMCPGVEHLSQRERDLLHVLNIKVPTDVQMIIDVSQGFRNEDVNFNMPHVGGTVCITPTMRPWVCHRSRLGSGVESLNLQNIFFEADQVPHLSAFSNDELQNLAGNAFNGSCCLAVMLTAIVGISAELVQTADTALAPAEPISPSGFGSDGVHTSHQLASRMASIFDIDSE